MARWLRDRPKPYRGANYAVRRWVLLIVLLLTLAWQLGWYR
jgi:hypothetical protein